MAAKTPMTIPIKLLHEGVGNNVTVELKSGEIYRGFLAAAGLLRAQSLSQSAMHVDRTPP